MMNSTAAFNPDLIDTTYSLFNSIETCDLDHVRFILSSHCNASISFLPIVRTSVSNSQKRALSSVFVNSDTQDEEIENHSENPSKKRVKQKHQHLSLALCDGWNALHIAVQQLNPCLMIELLHRIDVMASTKCHTPSTLEHTTTTFKSNTPQFRDQMMFDLLFQRNDIGEIPIMTCLRMMQFTNQTMGDPLFNNGLKVCSQLLERMVVSLHAHLNEVKRRGSQQESCLVTTSTSQHNQAGDSSLLSKDSLLFSSSTSTTPLQLCSYSSTSPIRRCSCRSVNECHLQKLKVIPTLIEILSLVKNSNGENCFHLAEAIEMDLLALVHRESFEYSFRKKLFHQRQHCTFVNDIEIILF